MRGDAYPSSALGLEAGCHPLITVVWLPPVGVLALPASAISFTGRIEPATTDTTA